MKRYLENTQDLRPETSTKLRAPDNRAGEIIGQAVEGFGRQLGNVAEEVDKIQAKFDEAAVRQADAEDALEIAKIKQRAMSAKGIDAAAAVEQADREIAEIGARRQESLKGSRRQTMYADIFSRRRLGATEQLGEHQIKQAEVAREASLDATIETSRTLAIDNHDSPEEFARNMAAIEQAVREKSRGMPPEAVAMNIAKVKSNIHEGVVEKLLSDIDTKSDAAIYIKDHANDILPDAETKLWAKVNPYLEEERTLADASWALSGADMPDGTEIDTPEPEGEPNPLAPTPAKAAATSARLSEVDPSKGFINPLGKGVGSVTSGFGKRNAPKAGASTEHGGIDIAAPAGTPIRPPMSGEVVFNGWDQNGGGWTVKIKHPNGYVTGYSHMRAKSALGVGAKVDNTSIIGGVGSTGNSTGNHLHYTVRQSEDGPRVDPAKVSWREAGIKQPSELPNYKPEDTDTASALSRLHARATRENWSAYRYEKAAAEVRQRANIQQALFKEDQQRVMDQVSAAIADADYAGKPITSRSQVPFYHRLDAGNRAAVDRALAANKAAAADGGYKANGEVYNEMTLMSLDPDQRTQFLRENIDLLSVTPTEKRRLKERQQKLKNDENGALAADLGRINTYVNRYSHAAGFSTKNVNAGGKEALRIRTQFADSLTALVDREQKRLGRPLTDIEMDAQARSLTISVWRRGSGATNKAEPLFRARANMAPGQYLQTDIVKVYNEMPPTVRESIRRGLLAKGRGDSMRLIVETYMAGSK